MKIIHGVNDLDKTAVFTLFQSDGNTLMDLAVFAAISFGFGGGAILGFLGGRVIGRKLSAASRSPRTVLGCASGGGVLMLLPTGYVSFVVGGTMGGGWGEVAGAHFGSAHLGVVLGLALGICAVLSTGLLVGAIFGGLIAKLITSFGTLSQKGPL